jgi:phosphopantothenoylcysteine decarboxylase/phosphopantothenate--cysteine ligase
MYNAALDVFPDMDAAILCAAVADFKPEKQVIDKMKREDKETMSLSLVRNKDIAQALGEIKRPDQVLAGFALETNDGITHAKGKLIRKNLDMIVLNSLEDQGAGFGHDTNKVTIIDREGNIEYFPLKDKKEVAIDIVLKLKTLIDKI